jgi:hypothetical protein
VGPTGRVVGVDLCREMVEKARRHADLLGLHKAEFVNAGIEKLPLPDASVDVVTGTGSATPARTSRRCLEVTAGLSTRTSPCRQGALTSARKGEG